MINDDILKDLLHKPKLGTTDKLLLCLAVDVSKPKTVAAIKRIARIAGLKIPTEWNISQILSRTKGLAIRVVEGWELTSDGKNHVHALVARFCNEPLVKVSVSLNKHLKRIKNPEIRVFVDESINCFERGFYRAAVVLSWVGAVAILYDHVLLHKLSDFNAEANRRNPKWKPAKSFDDLAEMKEHDFLDILQAISVIGKTVKQELQKQLTLRNGCGHPNKFQIGENTVAAHVETLILNVFSKF